MKEERKIKAIVCGTTFGQFYCEALRRMPEILFDGILSTGSVRSQRCAERYGVRSYTAADELPEDIQLACVAVRSGVLGGNGTELAAALLERGIHVIQEQPVHYKDAERCIRIAKQHGVCYRVGDLYEYLPNIRCFLESARAICRVSGPVYLDIGAASQVTYPLIRILAEALPSVRPFEIRQVSAETHPYDAVSASVAGIPAMFQIQNEVAPDDPDNFMHYLHRITIVTAHGRLCLDDTTGSVVWYHQMFVPVHDPEAGLQMREEAAGPVGLPQLVRLYPAKAQSFQELFRTEWIPAISADIQSFLRLISDGTAAETAAMYTKTVHAAKMWHTLTAALGFPALVRAARKDHTEIARTVQQLQKTFSETENSDERELYRGPAPDGAA